MLEVLGAIGAVNAVNAVARIGGAIIEGIAGEPESAPAANAGTSEDQVEISQHALLRALGDRFDPATMTIEDLNQMKDALKQAGVTEEEAGLLLAPLEERLGRLANGEIPADLSNLSWGGLFDELQTALQTPGTGISPEMQSKLAELGTMISG